MSRVRSAFPLVIAQLTEGSRRVYAVLSEHVTPFNHAMQMPDVRSMIDMATDTGRAMMDAMVTLQAQIIAFSLDYQMVMLFTLCAIPLAIMIGSPRPRCASSRWRRNMLSSSSVWSLSLSTTALPNPRCVRRARRCPGKFRDHRHRQSRRAPFQPPCARRREAISGRASRSQQPGQKYALISAASPFRPWHPEVLAMSVALRAHAVERGDTVGEALWRWRAAVRIRSATMIEPPLAGLRSHPRRRRA